MPARGATRRRARAKVLWFSMADEGAKINLKVVTMDGNEMLFKCRKTTPLQSLMDAFCREQRVFANYVQFKSDEGRCLNGAYTPQEVCGTVAVACTHYATAS